MRIPVLPLSALICGTGFLIYGIAATGQVPAPAQAISTGAAQVEHGAAVYKEKCATCHGENLQGSFNAQGLSGNTFQSQWRSKTVAELFGTISETMPPTSPGSLGREDALAVLAYILQRNGAPQRPQALTAGSPARVGEVLSGQANPSAPSVMGVPDQIGGRYGSNGPREILTITDRPGMGIDAAAQMHLKQLRSPLDRVTPVTDADAAQSIS